ncbi:flagellar basal body P-ring formation chaperone FlgA [Rubrivirga sp. S365]|uniref:flagellar basal body P-ring formation chaperone FlgA n=1 Tax=Rubrivirga sp. S365 TaxID=3076080 RepID=UPI0028C7F907|nr:flagellar basal body P-ring formation chaperone FlgA [Rubrivirga sp. S365]MDT7856065.1 flagellar basal body P-ring formation chaperone FlgA [Rubrivirga sp. S365]
MAASPNAYRPAQPQRTTTAPPRPALAAAFRVAAAVVLAALASAPGASAQAAPEARVQAAAEALLAERFPEAAPRLAPRVLRLAADVPPGAPVRLALAEARGVPRGHTRADVVTDAGRAGWALLYVAHFDSVAVARRALSRGDTLGSGAVEAAWIETTRFHGDPVAPAALRGGAAPTARRTVRAGEALRQSVLAWPTAVGTGDAVRVRYRRGGLLLTVDATARETGAVGEAVRVYSRSTGATYRVRVTAPGRADWIETL